MGSIRGNDGPPLQPDYSDTVENMRAWRDILQVRANAGDGLSPAFSETIDLLSRDIDRLELLGKGAVRNLPETTVSQKSRVQVLVVDDDPDFLNEVSDLLQRTEYSCTLARSAEEAKREIVNSSPDIVVLDCKLADESGLDLLDELRFLLPDESHCQFIVISGYPSVESVLQALRRRVSDYLIKPLSPEGLQSSLREAARIHNQRIEERSNSTALQTGLDRVDGMLSSLEARFTAARSYLVGATKGLYR